MARIVKCPICNKTKKIKHNNYNYFVCCYTKFPIEPNNQLKAPEELKEPEQIEGETLEFNEEPEIHKQEFEEVEEEPKIERFRCGECYNIFSGSYICPYCKTDWESEIKNG